MLEILQLNPEMQISLIAIFALIFGSFASLISYRLANKQPIIFTRSKCVNCGLALKIRNLIPLFSWLLQRGKCSNCKTKISLRYPAIEFSFLIVFMTIFFALKQQLDVKMLFYFAISGSLIVMSIVDLEEYFIPDSVMIFLAITVISFVGFSGGSSAMFAGLKGALLYTAFGALLFAFFYFTAGLEAIGIDDIKFFFVIGFLLGTANFLSFMLLSGIFGVIFGSIWQKVKQDATFPFAPALCLAAFLSLLFGQKIDPTELLGSILF